VPRHDEAESGDSTARVVTVDARLGDFEDADAWQDCGHGYLRGLALIRRLFGATVSTSRRASPGVELYLTLTSL
jgi:hypothetical protein